MKHKVGDRVRIKSWDWYDKNKNSIGRIKGFMPEMSGYLGKEAIIEKCYNLSYELNIDHHFWNWDDEMFDETYNENKMESKKVKINLPKNCEVDEVKASVENGFIVVEYIPKKKFTPKNGDVIYIKFHDEGEWIVIFSVKEKGVIFIHCALRTGINRLYADLESRAEKFCESRKISEIRLATEQEKKILFDALEKKNLIWNAEENKIEKIRWRAKYGQPYFFIGYDIEVTKCPEYNRSANDKCFEIGNYFQTEEDAQGYADKFKELLKNR